VNVDPNVFANHAESVAKNNKRSGCSTKAEVFGRGRTSVINDNFITTVNQEYIGSVSSVNLYPTDECDI
jgi:hypothetical protein